MDQFLKGMEHRSINQILEAGIKETNLAHSQKKEVLYIIVNPFP